MAFPDMQAEFDRDCARLSVSAPRRTGTLVRIVGLMLEARGIIATVGESCSITTADGGVVEAEVVGFKIGRAHV